MRRSNARTPSCAFGNTYTGERDAPKDQKGKRNGGGSKGKRGKICEVVLMGTSCCNNQPLKSAREDEGRGRE